MLMSVRVQVAIPLVIEIGNGLIVLRPDLTTKTGVGQAQRLHNFMHQCGERPMGNILEDVAQQKVVGIRILMLVLAS